MRTRVEVGKQLGAIYQRATKGEKSGILDHFCQGTGLSRPTDRRYLTSATHGTKKAQHLNPRRSRPLKYSTAAQEKLVWLWRIMQMPCGKYLVADMAQWIESLERHGELRLGQKGWTQEVREELLCMSAATVDRYLKSERHGMQLKGISTTKPGALLRNSIKIRRAGDEVETEPGFFEVDTVAHCGPSLKGEFARTLTFTDVLTGWIHLEVMRNNAHVHVRSALDAAFDSIPYQVQGLDCDNGSELINYDVVKWATQKDVYFTRSRPYRKNDQAHVESKNNHVVRKYGFHYRYDTQQERDVLGALWELVCLHMNCFKATRKPIGWTEDKTGRRKRIYDKPKTPLERLLEAEVLSTDQTEALLEQRKALNPAELSRNITRLQCLLTGMAKSKTEDMIVDVQEATARRQHKHNAGIKVLYV